MDTVHSRDVAALADASRALSVVTTAKERLERALGETTEQRDRHRKTAEKHHGDLMIARAMMIDAVAEMRELQQAATELRRELAVARSLPPTPESPVVVATAPVGDDAEQRFAMLELD